MRDAKNLFRHELIGLAAEVVESRNNSLVALKGRIVDETRNTVVFGNGDDKSVQKGGTTFRFPEYGVRIAGSLLVGRPEDRIKKRVK